MGLETVMDDRYFICDIILGFCIFIALATHDYIVKVVPSVYEDTSRNIIYPYQYTYSYRVCITTCMQKRNWNKGDNHSFFWLFFLITNIKHVLELFLVIGQNIFLMFPFDLQSQSYSQYFQLIIEKHVYVTWDLNIYSTYLKFAP